MPSINQQPPRFGSIRNSNGIGAAGIGSLFCFETQTHAIEEMGSGPTKTGGTYRWLKLDGKKVSFFHATDLALVVKVGDRVQYDLEQSGNYWNGKDLKLATALGEPAGDLTTVLERIAAALERIAAFFDRK